MAKSVEDQIAELSALAKQEPSEKLVDQLRKSLTSKHSIIVSKAADILAAKGITDCNQEMATILQSLYDQPYEKDKACLAKVSLAKALDSLGYQHEEIFVKGARIVQMEPTWGPPEDTAGGLRAVCATALARVGLQETLLRLYADLLNDPEPAPRSAVVRNLGQSIGGQTAEMLLRVKASIGDGNLGILEDCFSALLQIDSSEYYKFVQAKIDLHNPDESRAAAFAIAQSEDRSKAYTILTECYEEIMDEEFREMLLMALSLTKTKEAYTFLLHMIEEEGIQRAKAALSALTCFPMNDKQRATLEKIVIARNDLDLIQVYKNNQKFS